MQIPCRFFIVFKLDKLDGAFQKRNLGIFSYFWVKFQLKLVFINIKSNLTKQKKKWCENFFVLVFIPNIWIEDGIFSCILYYVNNQTFEIPQIYSNIHV